MLHFAGRGLLLDVEGTTSSVRFVSDVLFHYSRQQLESYLRSHWDTDALAATRELIAREAGAESFAEWTHSQPRLQAREQLHREVLRLIDRDAKTTGLKQLQGLVWEEGFQAGKLRAHVYPDVPPALRRWLDAGREIRIYSSGSVLAQRLFFGHTDVGDLTGFFSGHYDTTTGPKRAQESYACIAADWGLAPREILFLSDVVDELDAARAAGLQTALVVRPENSPVADAHGHPSIRDFSEIELG